ncbi:SDR family oxidoreductase [Ferrovibrio xuzhouensis]|uniref:SDR family oxidoreductase n=1 Tax=Ferrovibrio xuzhouensis TaxID=1576914 RepID=A0ABV7VH08_9PROT
MRLDGARVLVTGAGSGIGRALAIALAARGARLVLNGRREAALAATQALLPIPANAVIVAADITTAAGRDALFQACTTPGGLDLLVNNAGVVISGRFADLTDADMSRLFATNVIAPMALTRQLLPLLQLSSQARIVNIGSVFGDIGHPLFAGYCASKFALRGLSDALRRELAAVGIGVTYAAPRATRTAAADGFADLMQPFDMAMDMPETIAAQIVAAVAQDRDRIYARGAERLFVLMQRLLPQLVDRALIGKYRRFAAR